MNIKSSRIKNTYIKVKKEMKILALCQISSLTKSIYLESTEKMSMFWCMFWRFRHWLGLLEWTAKMSNLWLSRNKFKSTLRLANCNITSNVIIFHEQWSLLSSVFASMDIKNSDSKRSINSMVTRLSVPYLPLTFSPFFISWYIFVKKTGFIFTQLLIFKIFII